MIYQKKFAAILTLAIVVIAATAATKSSNKQYKNLQILPQDISEKSLDSVMGAFNTALKVNCDFCHIAPKDITGLTPPNTPLDFSLDNGMKEEARRMMRMTIAINKNYFHTDSLQKEDYKLNVISCNTCHRGNPYPANE